MLKDEFEKLKSINILETVSKLKIIPPRELSLKISKNKNLAHRAIAELVECHIKADKKLPLLAKKPVLFDKVALEQASSEFTAKYKSSLISGNKLVDLTGGLGIDDIYFSKSFETIDYCEISDVLVNIFEFNLNAIKIKNITVNNCDSIEYLSTLEDNSIDWIYVDPARRDANRRSVDLEFCTPNVYDNLELFFQKSQNVMIKVAPAFDITEAIKRFTNLKEIHIVALDGECKELLLLLDKNVSNITVKIFSVTLYSKSKSPFVLNSVFRANYDKETSPLSKYFYEPDCALIKSNLVDILANKHNLSFINKITPFLTSHELDNNFPGRSFEITSSLQFNEKKIKDYLKVNKITKANIARRDFRLTVDELKSKFKLKDGGDVYIFFTSDLNRRSIVVFCKKV